MFALYRRVRESVQKDGLISPGDRVLAACSGGADSTALVLLLMKLRTKIPFTLGILHINHRLRPESDGEEEHLRRFAEQVDLPLKVVHWNPTAGGNLEERAREFRYEAFRQERERGGWDSVATAHTRDDQTETFLMRLLRGSGSEGLASIPRKREGWIIRPLLDIPKADLLLYLQRLGLPFLEDPSNCDERFLRNRVRHRLIPFLKEHFTEEVEPILAREADILREESLYLEGQAEAWLKNRLREGDSLELEGFEDLPRALARRVVRAYLLRLRGNLRRIERVHCEAVLGMRNGDRVSLPDLVLERSAGRLSPMRAQSVPFLIVLAEGLGEVTLPTGERYLLRLLGEGEPRPCFDDSRRALLDYESVRGPVTVRNRREGDRIRPWGMGGKRRRLKEVLRERGVDRFSRGCLPLFEDGEGEILWVPGIPVCEKRRLTDGSRRILLIERVPSGEE